MTCACMHQWCWSVYVLSASVIANDAGMTSFVTIGGVRPSMLYSRKPAWHSTVALTLMDSVMAWAEPMLAMQPQSKEKAAGMFMQLDKAYYNAELTSVLPAQAYYNCVDNQAKPHSFRK